MYQKLCARFWQFDLLTKRINRCENSNFGFQCCFKTDEIQYYFKSPFFTAQFMKRGTRRLIESAYIWKYQ